ncbi:hypothetical protein F11_05960 [Rhodospirillum rubrum F11]|nr:hypothetical protein F11_05960 [Rhodospirillum rubrum F11]
MPDAEYDQRSRFGVVIDPDRHALCNGSPRFAIFRK